MSSPEADIPIIRALLAEGVNRAEIARRFNCDWCTIDRIHTGRTWRHVPEMSALKRNFTFEQDGWTFHYIARARRLQVYLPLQDRHTGLWDKFGEYTDEVAITLYSQAQGKLWAREWVVNNHTTGGGTAENFRREELGRL